MQTYLLSREDAYRALVVKNTVACFRKKGWDSLSTLEELTKKLSLSNSSSQGSSSTSGSAASASGSYCVKCNKGGAVSTRSKVDGAARDVEIENVGRHLNNSADKLSGIEHMAASPKRKGKMETGFAEKGPVTRTSKRPRALDQNQEGAVIDQQIAKRSKP